jgi:hypothetical protein
MNDDQPERDPRKCPRNKADGTPCGNIAGKGTNHKGKGPRYKHGGRSRTWDAHFEKEMVAERMRTYGSPVDVEPHVALLEEVRRTAGHVAWLGAVVAELAHKADKGAVPTYSTNQQNGKPGVVFSGSPVLMTAGSLSLSTWTLFVVMKVATTTGQNLTYALLAEPVC